MISKIVIGFLIGDAVVQIYQGDYIHGNFLALCALAIGMGYLDPKKKK